jgi:glycosyltransferase involved in cell wall biosynthesis
MRGLPWGGSEYLWSRAAHRLLKRGHVVSVSYKHWPDGAPAPLRRLREAGARVRRYERYPLLARAWRRGRRVLRRRAGVTAPSLHQRWLRREQPGLVLVSMGNLRSRLDLAEACRRRDVPYALLVHAANWARWLEGAATVARYRRAFCEAEACFFVSAENREIAEANLGAALPHASVVDNPLWKPDAPLPWPSSEENWRLACVGRLHFRQKAQDVILRVLRREKWRSRPLQMRFYGEDHGDETRLCEQICLHELEPKVRYAGYAGREHIWRAHHGLLLPSRYEGMPMVTPEAMACGRVPVVTRCGRNPDLVADGDTGFLAEAATERLVDRALERAWQRRSEWKKMGRRAAQHIRENYEDDPPGAFAQKLLECVPA